MKKFGKMRLISEFSISGHFHENLWGKKLTYFLGHFGLTEAKIKLKMKMKKYKKMSLIFEFFI